MSAFEKKMINEVVEELLAQGFTVYLAKRGNYGFYTDDTGEKTVSFEADLLSVKFSGNYVPLYHGVGRKIGTGWRLEKDTYRNMLRAGAPRWAVGRVNRNEWRYETASDKLSNNFSGYKKVEPEL